MAETLFSEPDLVDTFSEGPQLRKMNPPRIERIERIDTVLALLPLLRDCLCKMCLLEPLCYALLPLPQHCAPAFVALALAALGTPPHGTIPVGAFDAG